MELTRWRRWAEHAGDREHSASGNRGPHLESTRSRDGPREIRDAGANRRHLVPSALLTPRVANAGRAFQFELADPNLLVLDREIGELLRQLRDLCDGLALTGPDQRQILELARQVGPHAGARVHRDFEGRAHTPSIDYDRGIGRQVEPSECQVQLLDRYGGLEMNRVESELLDLDQVRRARGHRACDHSSVIAQGRDVVRLDLDVVRRPRPPFGQRAVFESDRPIDQREPVDGYIERLLGRPRAFDQIGEVEILRESYDTKGWLLEDQLSYPDMTAEERQEMQPHIKPLAVGKGCAAVRLGDVELVDREPTAQQLNVDAIDADRSHRDRLEPRDRYLPRYSW